MKKVFTFLSILFLSFSLYGLSGIFSGGENIKIVKTKWFDIVYPETCQISAALLYDNGDKIYQEVTGQYGLEPSFRITVVITDLIDTYNAMSTPVPYNRILMYDTSNQVLDDLSALDTTFLTTFRHELTHTVTMNMKNGFWKGFTTIFGDPILPGLLFVTPGFAEGAAVASESMEGAGRLNDEFATHFVKQAKIEGSFPSYYDVQGTNSSSALALHYYFNGPFHEYLQNKYGMEKYALWWHRVVNMTRPGVNWSFYATYGTSIRKEWKLFQDSYEVPDVIKNPIENKLVKDFFIPESSYPSIENNSGTRFSDLQVSDKGLFFTKEYLLDKRTKQFFFVPNEMLNDKKIKPIKLFEHQLIDNFTVSKDSRFLTISYYSTGNPNITSKIKIYDMESKNYFEIKEDSVKNGSVIKYQNDYYLVFHKFNSPYNSLIIKKLILQNNKIENISDVFTYNESANVFVSNFTDLGNGTFAYIKKSLGSFSIIVSDLQGNIKSQFDLPEGIKIRQLSENNGNLYFSWVKKGTMARLGMLNLKNGVFSLSNKDISGGIFNPVSVNIGDGQRLVYIGCYFNENRILTFESSSEIIKDCENITSLENIATELENPTALEITQFKNTDISSIEKPYKTFENLHKGIILPFSIYSSEMIGENFGKQSPSQMLPIGITYASANPWNNGGVNDDLLIITGGWSFLTNSFGFETLINQGTSTSLLLTSLSLKTEFDGLGWKQSSGELTLGSGFHFGTLSSLSLQNTMKVTGGRQNKLNNNINYLNLFTFWQPELFASCAPENNTVAYNISDIFSIKYSSIGAKGPGAFEYGGFSLGVSAGYVYDSVKGNVFVVNPEISVKIPKLIPLTQKRGFTYNLPLKIDLSLMPISSNFAMTQATLKTAGRSVLDTNVETVLFGYDLQKSIPYVSMIYVNQLYLTAGYTSTIASYKGDHKNPVQIPYVLEYLGNLVNGKSIYLDSLYLKLVLKATPNIGLLANPYGVATLNFYGQVNFTLNVLPEEKRNIYFTFGLTADF